MVFIELNMNIADRQLKLDLRDQAIIPRREVR